jgi:hypothetical protein
MLSGMLSKSAAIELPAALRTHSNWSISAQTCSAASPAGPAGRGASSVPAGTRRETLSSAMFGMSAAEKTATTPSHSRAASTLTFRSTRARSGCGRRGHGAAPDGSGPPRSSRRRGSVPRPPQTGARSRPLRRSRPELPLRVEDGGDERVTGATAEVGRCRFVHCR